MSKPTECISVLGSKALQARWMTTRTVDIENAQRSKDTCAVTFNIDQLQQFIDYVKEESQNQGMLKPGIRVYFAANDSALSDKPTVSRDDLQGSSRCRESSPKTIDGYRQELFNKLRIKNRVVLVIYALKNNLVEL